MINKKKFKTYFEVLKTFEKSHKIKIFQFFFLIFLSLVEIISLSSVIPFVMAIQDPNSVLDSIYYKEYLGSLNLNENNLGTYFFIFFIILVIFSLILKIIFLRINCNISYDIIRFVGDRLFKQVLSKNFLDFRNLNSKDIVTTVSLRSQSVGESTYCLISSLGSVVIILFLIFNSLLFIGNQIIFLFIILSFLYSFWWLIIKKKINKYGKIFSQNYEKLIRNTPEAMNMFSEIKLYNLNSFFLKILKK